MPKRNVSPLKGQSIRLRLLEHADLPMTLRWRNDDAIRPWFFNSDLISAPMHEQWWHGYRERDDDFVFVIEDTAANHQPVGQASVYRVDWERKTAEFGRLMLGEPAARGRGLARDAVNVLTAFAFDGLALTELMLQLKEANSVAAAVYQSCGYRVVNRDAGVVTMTLSRPGRE